MLLRAVILALLTVAPAVLQGCMTWETTRTESVEHIQIGAAARSIVVESGVRKGEALEFKLSRLEAGRRKEIQRTQDETSFQITYSCFYHGFILGKKWNGEDLGHLIFRIIFVLPGSIFFDPMLLLVHAPIVFPAGAIESIDPGDVEREVDYHTPTAMPPGTEIVLSTTTPGVAVTRTAVHGEQVLFPIPDIAIAALRAGVGRVECELYEQARPAVRVAWALTPETQLDALDAWFMSAGPPEQRLEAWREVHALVPETATALRDSVYRRVQIVAEEVRVIAAQKDAQRQAEAEQARLAAERRLQEEQKRLALARKEEQEARRQEEDAKRARLAAEEAARADAERRRLAMEEAEIQKIMEADRRAEAVERRRLAQLSVEERRREQEAPRAGSVSAPARTPGVAGTGGAGAPGAVSAPQGEGRTYVLAIGINKYDDASIPALKYAEEDAKDIFSFFANAKRSPTDRDRVSRLTGAEATRAGILKAISEKLAQKAVNANDTAILFFAGHGFADPRTTYIAPVDTEWKSLHASAISASQLAEAWSGVRAGRKVLLVDACRSGGLGDGMRGIGSVAQAPELAKASVAVSHAGGRAVMITAAGESEFSMEDPESENGCFTLGLLNGLGGDADRDGDGRVTDEELGKFLVTEVPALAARVGGNQTPDVKMIGKGGAVILSRTPGAR